MVGFITIRVKILRNYWSILRKNVLYNFASSLTKLKWGRSSTFDLLASTYLIQHLCLNKSKKLSEEVSCTEPSPSVSFPWSKSHLEWPRTEVTMNGPNNDTQHNNKINATLSIMKLSTMTSILMPSAIKLSVAMPNVIKLNVIAQLAKLWLWRCSQRRAVGFQKKNGKYSLCFSGQADVRLMWHYPA